MSLSYLALGDSYTIGEALPLIESFPYQTVQQLRTQNITMAAPEIIARTGWTTDELQAAMDRYTFLPQYDVVTLLIGVNNQYRGYSIETYKEELERLLQQAVILAGRKKENVVVLSIPDYSVTPFAQEKNKERIQKEIEAFNQVKYGVCAAHNIHFINITESTRRAKNNVHLLAADGLHPSAEEYREWALPLAQKIAHVLP